MAEVGVTCQMQSTGESAVWLGKASPMVVGRKNRCR